jgi:hypothetical protein
MFIDYLKINFEVIFELEGLGEFSKVFFVVKK